MNKRNLVKAYILENKLDRVNANELAWTIHRITGIQVSVSTIRFALEIMASRGETVNRFAGDWDILLPEQE